MNGSSIGVFGRHCPNPGRLLAGHTEQTVCHIKADSCYEITTHVASRRDSMIPRFLKAGERGRDSVRDDESSPQSGTRKTCRQISGSASILGMIVEQGWLCAAMTRPTARPHGTWNKGSKRSLSGCLQRIHAPVCVSGCVFLRYRTVAAVKDRPCHCGVYSSSAPRSYRLQPFEIHTSLHGFDIYSIMRC